MKRRVVVTGIGWVTPLGSEIEAVWQRLLKGESGVGPITLFDASTFPTRIAAEVKDWTIADAGEDPEKWKYQGRHTHFAIGAAKQAVSDSGILDGTLDFERFGVYTGSGEGRQDFERFTRMMTAGLRGDKAVEHDGFDVSAFIRCGIEQMNPISELEQEPHVTTAHLASLFGAQGPCVNCLTACAASSQALGEATELIRRNEVDVMLSGGAHTMIHPFGVTGFNLLTALSTRNDEPQRASRPFDRERDGFVLGEGAGMLVLEELEHAKKRGAKIYGEITGYGATADAYRITDIHPEGRGAGACMKLALEDADVDHVDYVNAHGTSTAVNDRTETKALKLAFGEAAYKTPMSSTKSMMGHLIGAAGATEMIISLLAMRDNVLPPTINYENPDPDCDLDYVPNEARPAKVDIVMSNSFGFGGQNASVVAKRFA
ncbi:MAG: beta-ketoacyl-[acyl-carrier-protein] synthase family protein [Thermoguttaceae bacterium]|nr:beta-ketoacyl-[acyl-carrier-protein] synthase family protein [Thermoguttaceae bacterium]